MKACAHCGKADCPRLDDWTTYDQRIAAAQVCALYCIASALTWIAHATR